MPDKAREAFRTISEVANWLDIPAHVLRFWESKFSQIKPVKRAGGRRYYRPADMELIGGIKTLLHDNGLTIRGVQKMIKEDGVKAVSALSPAIVNISDEEADARRAARRARRAERLASRKSADIPDAEITTPTEAKETEAKDRASEEPAELIRDEEYAQEVAQDAPVEGDTVERSQNDQPQAAGTETHAETQIEAQSRHAKRQALLEDEAALIEKEVADAAPALPKSAEIQPEAPVFQPAEQPPEKDSEKTPAETAEDKPAPKLHDPVSTNLEAIELTESQAAKTKTLTSLYDRGLEAVLEDRPTRAELKDLHERLSALRNRMARGTRQG